MTTTTSDLETKKQQLLEELAKAGQVNFACGAAGVPPRTYYHWRKQDPVFANAADYAKGHGRVPAPGPVEAKPVRRLITDPPKWLTPSESGDNRLVPAWVVDVFYHAALKELGISDDDDLCERLDRLLDQVLDEYVPQVPD